MIQYNMLDAKNNLSKICKMLVDKQEDYIIVASNGNPVAKIVPYEKEFKRKPGCLKEKYGQLCDVDWFNDDITNLFYGENK